MAMRALITIVLVSLVSGFWEINEGADTATPASGINPWTSPAAEEPTPPAEVKDTSKDGGSSLFSKFMGGDDDDDDDDEKTTTKQVVAAATPTTAAPDAKKAPAAVADANKAPAATADTKPAANITAAAKAAPATAAPAQKNASAATISGEKKLDEKMLDEKMKAFNKTAESKKIDDKAKLVKMAKDIKAGNATNITVAKSFPIVRKQSAEDHHETIHLREMSFFEIIGTWQWEFIRCVPIAAIAYSLLALAVHQPKMLDVAQNWHSVGGITGGADGMGDATQEKRNPYGSFTL